MALTPELTPELLTGITAAMVGVILNLRELTYKVGAATPFIALGNFYFYRAGACSVT